MRKRAGRPGPLELLLRPITPHSLQKNAQRTRRRTARSYPQESAGSRPRRGARGHRSTRTRLPDTRITWAKAVASTGTLAARGGHDQDSSASRKAPAGKVLMSSTPVVDDMGEAGVQCSGL